MEETPVPVRAGAVGAQNNRRTLMEYAHSSLDGIASCIRRLTMQANNFKLKPSYVQMIQNSVQFHGLPSENPNLHITNFLEICDMFRVNGVTDDAIRLRLFSFFLKDKVKTWLNSLPTGSITNWATLV